MSFGQRRINAQSGFFRRAGEREPFPRGHCAGARLRGVVSTQYTMRECEFRIEIDRVFEKFLAAGKRSQRGSCKEDLASLKKSFIRPKIGHMSAQSRGFGNHPDP